MPAFPLSFSRSARALLAGLLVFSSAAEDEAPSFPWVELPDGPAAKAWAAVGPETDVAQWTESFPAERLTQPDAWQDPRTWKDWSQWLSAAATSDEKSSERRAGLALLALNQGRTADAWEHFQACPEPAWLARLMPSFLPGAPPSAKLGKAGKPLGLEDACVLYPRIPPAEVLPSGMITGRKASVRGLNVGEATVDLSITFDSYGVQIDVVLVSGEYANVLVMIPEPDDYQIRVEYVDWMRQETVREPLLVELRKEQPQSTVFGRILGYESAWPSAGDGHVPAELDEGGLWIEHPADEEPGELLTAIAESIAGVIQKPVRLRAATNGARESTDGVTGTIVHLPAAGARRDRKLAWLASAIEEHVLRSED